MKHIKKYTSKKIIPKINFLVGDYVLIDCESRAFDHRYLNKNYRNAIIIDVMPTRVLRYAIEFTYDNNKLAVYDKEVLRKLTSDEIDQIKLEKETISYNL